MHALRDLGCGKSSLEGAILEEGDRMVQHIVDLMEVHNEK